MDNIQPHAASAVKIAESAAKPTAEPACSLFSPKSARSRMQRRRMRWALRGAATLVLSALLLAGLFVGFGAPSAQAQDTAVIDLGKEVFNGVSVVESGEVFEYVLSYACSSINVACDDVRILDQLPPNVEFIGAVTTKDVESVTETDGDISINFISPLAGGSSGVVRLAVRFAPGTMPGTEYINRAQMVASNAMTVTDDAPIVLADGTFKMFARKDQITEDVVPGFPAVFLT